LIRLEELSTFKLDPARDACIDRVENLRIDRRGRRTTIYYAEGPDPQIVFSTARLPANSVKTIRFRLKRAFTDPAYAQLFWKHSPKDDFSEENSAKVELTRGNDTWGRYAFLFDDPILRGKWDRGREIFQLRFDPTNVPGKFEMGPLEVISRKS
jgi:hypothetical protein